MGGRDKAAQSERTKSDMIIAMERGAKPGQPFKLTASRQGHGSNSPAIAPGPRNQGRRE
jgi:hypothetical protein